jgi:hypothetical protein
LASARLSALANYFACFLLRIEPSRKGFLVKFYHSPTGYTNGDRAFIRARHGDVKTRAFARDIIDFSGRSMHVKNFPRWRSEAPLMPILDQARVNLLLDSLVNAMITLGLAGDGCER